MDIYHIWCNLKPGVGDLAFAADIDRYLGRLRDDGRIRAFRITRCKLGLRPPALKDFHITIEFDDLAQLQAAFDAVSARTDPVESLHHAVNAKAQDVVFALYRDFPDAGRVAGEERV